MVFEGALVKEQGVTFAIVVVKKYVVQNQFEAQRTIASFGSSAFPGLPVILMAQDYRGVPTYYGRQDIVRFLANVPMKSIPWRKFTV